jgi:hypothetical protein
LMSFGSPRLFETHRTRFKERNLVDGAGPTWFGFNQVDEFRAA